MWYASCAFVWSDDGSLCFSDEREVIAGDGICPSSSSSSLESESKEELESRYMPWAEAALFNANVSHVTTVEPIGVKISSNYENFTSLELSEVGRSRCGVFVQLIEA